jgi:hypothetical protein
VLKEVAAWMTDRYRSQQLLSGIIYLHPITSTWMTGTSRMNLDMFTNLVGPDSFKNIILVSTKWDLLASISIGERREQKLKKYFWKDLIDKGSITARSFGSKTSSLTIVTRVAFDRRISSPSGAPLNIQREIVEEQRVLSATSAGEVLAARLDGLEQSYRNGIEQLKLDLMAGRATMKEERAAMENEMQAKINMLAQEKVKLKDDLRSQNREVRYEQKPATLNAHVHLRLTTEEIVDLGPPLPYSQALTLPHAVIYNLITFGASSLTTVWGLYKLLDAMVKKALRPQLQKGYSRVEWTCVSA